MAYVHNIAEFLAFCIQFGPGEHLYNYVDKPDINMNALVAHCRSVLWGKKGVGLRMPSWLGVLLGYGFDGLATIIGRRLPISAIRVKKFMGTTAFNTSISKTGFTSSITLEQGLERTLRHEFTETRKGVKVFYRE